MINSAPEELQVEPFADRLVRSQLLKAGEIEKHSAKNASILAARLIQDGRLTKFQAEQVTADHADDLVLGN